jgi:hypothetical protein
MKNLRETWLAWIPWHVIESKERETGGRRPARVPAGDRIKMANSLLPPEERNLTPDQVEALDKRREWGHTLLVIACQFAVIATVLLLWVGQDLTYSPGWVHPMAYYFALAVGLVVVLGVTGMALRSGTPRID